MNTRRHVFQLSLALLPTLMWAASAVAQEPALELAGQTGAHSAVTSSSSAATANAPHRSQSRWNAPAISETALADRSGGTAIGTTLNDMKLRGVVADNRAVNVSTGTNLISEGALANSAGLPMVIQNSGNNVLIQSATIVNIQLK